MELPENFKPFTEHIKIIRKFLFPEFLMNTTEQWRWYCMNIYNLSPYIYMSDDGIDDYLGDDNNNIFYPSISPYECYNIKTLTYTRRDEVKNLNQNDIFNLLSKIYSKYILEILENIIFPSNDTVKKLIAIQSGNRVALSANNILESASPEFCIKYHDKLSKKNFIKYLNPQEITIISQYNEAQCTVPLNIFSMYCDFYNLMVDYNVLTITIPIKFTKKAGQFLVQCLMYGSLLDKHDLTVDDYAGFKSVITYLGIMIDQ